MGKVIGAAALVGGLLFVGAGQAGALDDVSAGAGNGGTAVASADGGSVYVGDYISGMGEIVLVISADGGIAASSASGGSDNVVVVFED